MPAIVIVLLFLVLFLLAFLIVLLGPFLGLGFAMWKHGKGEAVMGVTPEVHTESSKSSE
jgi:hypothetical protein